MKISFPPPARHSKASLGWWSALALLVLLADYITGPRIQFPILYLAPVTLAAYHSGFAAGLALALLLAGSRLLFGLLLWENPPPLSEEAINAAILTMVLGVFAGLVNRLAIQQLALAKEIRVLRGLLPICSFCKKIRTSDNSWEQLEQYITDHSEAKFSHGFCPACAKKHYGVELP